MQGKERGQLIWKELDEKRIYLGLKAESCDEVFEQLGKPLIEQGYAKENYVEGLKEREAEFSTGLPTSIPVAIPHTSAEYVKKTTYSIAVLEKPVPFVEMGTENDVVNVEIVFMLTIAEAHGHIDKLQRVMAMIQDEEVLKKIKSAKDAQTIIEIVKQKEETL